MLCRLPQFETDRPDFDIEGLTPFLADQLIDQLPCLIPPFFHIQHYGRNRRIRQIAYQLIVVDAHQGNLFGNPDIVDFAHGRHLQREFVVTCEKANRLGQ